MKVVVGLTLVALASASSAAIREDENGERQRKMAELGHHMARHLRKDGVDPAHAAQMHTMRHVRESDRGSRAVEPSVASEKKAMHAEKIRRVAEQLGQHRQYSGVQAAMAPELQRAHADRHSLAAGSKPEMGKKPTVAEATSEKKSRDKKHTMQKLAQQMSRTVDPHAVGDGPTLKEAAGAEEARHEDGAARKVIGKAAVPLQDRLKGPHVMGMQQKIAQAAHQSFSAGAVKGKDDGESKEANDGDE